MALFGLFSSNSRKSSGKPSAVRTVSGMGEAAEALRSYSGMRVEVMNMENNLLFLAKLFILKSGSVELQQVSEVVFGMGAGNAPDMGNAPAPENGPGAGNAPAPENAPGAGNASGNGPEPFAVRLRGYEERLQKAIHMTASITRRSPEAWRVEDLKIVSKENDRAFFRQNTQAAGEVTRIGRNDSGVQVCEVINISAGGVCIRTREEYENGDKLMLKARLIPGKGVTPLLCEIRRANEKRGGLYEYGCRFLQLSKADEDQIAKAIMDMQRSQLKRQMGR